MSIKSYLRECFSAFIQSRSAWIAQRAMPAATRVKISVPFSETDWTFYTPPTAGFMTIVPKRRSYYDMRSVTNATNWGASFTGDLWAGATIPVRRGNTLSLKTWTPSDGEPSEFYFVPAEGES